MKLPASLADGADRAVTLTTLAGLLLVAPLEHSLGMALGLSWWHAWTVTALIEGAAGTCVILGFYVAAALALTGGSVLIGSLWSAELQVRADHARDPKLYPATTITDDPVRAALAGLAVVLFVCALALVHAARRRHHQRRDEQAAAQREQDRADSAAEHARQIELARLDAEREQARLAAEHRDREDARRHAAQMDRARAFDEQERARLALDAERERARLAREEAAAEQARADAERARADRERAQADAERARAAAEQDRAAREQARAEAEQYASRLRDDRAFAEQEWMRHRWPADELADRIGVSESRARALVAEWGRPRSVEREA